MLYSIWLIILKVKLYIDIEKLSENFDLVLAQS
jgi:hypothetical protein